MSVLERDMLISRDSYETRVAIVEDSKLVELYIERADRSVVGNVYLGKVTDVLPGMQAAFVDIGLEKNAFLYVDDIRNHDNKPRQGRTISSLLTVGKPVLVQVAKDPMGTKGARITMDISIPGRFVVLMPFANHIGVSKKIDASVSEKLHDIVRENLNEGTGAIIRTAAASAGEQELIADINFLNRLWKRVMRHVADGVAPEVVYTEMDLAMRYIRDVYSDEYNKLVIDDKTTHEKIVSFLKRSAPELVKRISIHKDPTVSLFDYYGLEPQITQALSREIDLPSGGRIGIDVTEALIAIDVNTGSFVGRRNLEETLLKTNLEAANEAMRQVRLRDMGGIIIIDFIDMESSANRKKLEEKIEELLERDRNRTSLSSISPLGLVQIARKRTTQGVYALLTEVCPHCQGQGRSLSDESSRIVVERKIRSEVASSRENAFLFAVNPRTLENLTQPGVNFSATLKSETGNTIHLVTDETLGTQDAVMLIEGRAEPKLIPRRGKMR